MPGVQPVAQILLVPLGPQPLTLMTTTGSPWKCPLTLSSSLMPYSLEFFSQRHNCSPGFSYTLSRYSHCSIFNLGSLLSSGPTYSNSELQELLTGPPERASQITSILLPKMLIQWPSPIARSKEVPLSDILNSAHRAEDIPVIWAGNLPIIYDCSLFFPGQSH